MKRIREVHYGHFDIHYGIRSHIGELYSGDEVCLVEGNEYVLVGIIDGLGHGKKAAKIAQDIKSYVEIYYEEPLKHLVENAHHHFIGSQGASVGFAKVYTEGKVEYVGLGNVTCRVINWQTQEQYTLLSKDGALGVRKRNLDVATATMGMNESLILYSDGISNEIIRNNYRWGSTGSKKMINDIILTYGKAHDDASFIYLNRKKTNEQL